LTGRKLGRGKDAVPSPSAGGVGSKKTSRDTNVKRQPRKPEGGGRNGLRAVQGRLGTIG